MDEMGIMDMDELAIEHSHLEFQQEMKGAVDKADSHSKHSKGRRQKHNDSANGIVEGNNNGKTTVDVAVVADVNLLDSFQPVKNTSRTGNVIDQYLQFFKEQSPFRWTR